jgi:hypothetical protein
MKSPITILFLFCLTISVSAQQPNQSNNQKNMTPADNPQMKAWMAYMTPGMPQQMMAKSAGEWKAEVMQFQDPSQPPMRSTAAVHNEMILGGRYLSTKYNGNMMGMPFEGMGTMAYDNGTKMYYSTWVDNMGTGISYMKGTMSADGKSLELKGSSYDPTQGKEVMMRQVTTFIDDNHQKMEFYSMMNGKEVKMMEMNLSR